MRTQRGAPLGQLLVVGWGVILTGALLLSSRGSVLAPGAAAHPKPGSSHHVARPRDVRITAAGLDYRFVPQHIKVRAGTSVIWINGTAAPHTVTIPRGRTLNATIGPFRRIAHTFREAGTFSYFCRYHPYMLGVVTVTR